MKKILLTFILLGTIQFSNAQEVGIRFGNMLDLNVAVDGVFSLDKFSRIHADLSFGNGGVGVEALWDFIFKPVGTEELYWYAGVGPSMFIGDDFSLGVCGEIGLEYRFKGAPIALGLDWRPNFEIIDDTSFDADEFGLNVRYVFGK